MGGSFGGYMANWVAGHTDRFRAIVTHASLWNLDQFGRHHRRPVLLAARVRRPADDAERYATALTAPRSTAITHPDARHPRRQGLPGADRRGAAALVGPAPARRASSARSCTSRTRTTGSSSPATSSSGTRRCWRSSTSTCSARSGRVPPAVSVIPHRTCSSWPWTSPGRRVHADRPAAPSGSSSSEPSPGRPTWSRSWTRRPSSSSAPRVLAARPDDAVLGEEGGDAARAERCPLGDRSDRRHRQLPVPPVAMGREHRRRGRRRRSSRAWSTSCRAARCSPRRAAVARFSTVNDCGAAPRCRQRRRSSRPGSATSRRGGRSRPILAAVLPRVRDVRRRGACALDLCYVGRRPGGRLLRAGRQPLGLRGGWAGGGRGRAALGGLHAGRQLGAPAARARTVRGAARPARHAPPGTRPLTCRATRDADVARAVGLNLAWPRRGRPRMPGGRYPVPDLVEVAEHANDRSPLLGSGRSSGRRQRVP